jgi:predicted transcriptional regulator
VETIAKNINKLDVLSEHDISLIKLINKYGPLSNSQISRLSGKSVNITNTSIKKLINFGILANSKNSKEIFYFINM